jgi:hypothetical protein
LRFGFWTCSAAHSCTPCKRCRIAISFRWALSRIPAYVPNQTGLVRFQNQTAATEQGLLRVYAGADARRRMRRATDDLPSRRLKPDLFDSETALEQQAKAFARALRDCPR